MVSTETLALAFDATATVVNAACVVSVFFWRSRLASREQFAAHEQRIRDLEHGPDWEVLNEVKNELGSMKTSLAKMEAKLEIRANTIDRIDEYLRERGR